jgi:hypothetical protein
MLHTILENSTDKINIASSGGGFGFPITQKCSVVTPSILITTTPPLEGNLTPLTIAIIPLRTTIPQPNNKHPPKQQQAYQEGQ